MPPPFRLYCRSNGRYYVEDVATGSQTSLRTRNRSEAMQRLAARRKARVIRKHYRAETDRSFPDYPVSMCAFFGRSICCRQ
jgi:hypothetical protein